MADDVRAPEYLKLDFKRDLPHPSDARVGALSVWAFIALVQLADAGLIILAGIGAAFLARHFDGSAAVAVPVCLLVVPLVAAAAHLIFDACRLYSFAAVRRPFRSGLLATAAWCIAIGAVVSIALLPSTGMPHARSWALLWLLLGGAAVAAARPIATAVARTLRGSGRLGWTIYVVGDGHAMQTCIGEAQDDANGVSVLGYFTDDESGSFPLARGLRRLGGLAEVAHAVQWRPVDAVVVALAPAQYGELAGLLSQLRRIPVPVSVALCFAGLPPATRAAGRAGSRVGGRLGTMPLLTLSDRPLSGWTWIAKDLQDRAIAVLALLLAAPVMLAVALAIRLSSPGPVLFRQIRRGYGGREFLIYKFRSMHLTDKASQVDTQAGRLAMTAPDDPRLFPVGRFLRRTSLDELPQLFNVILGDMWLVGPRPHSPIAHVGGVFYAAAVDDYVSRYRIKPGITGWAQVNGWRGPTVTIEQIRKRVEHDLFYVENWSTAFDFRILLMTLFKGFLHHNAF